MTASKETYETTPCVFVVDDDETTCRGFARLIRLSGYEVETYGSAHDFLATAQYSEVCPSCLVLDIQLPDRSGLDLQSELNGILPIILITQE
jgi:FixJ family two-component response regulator